MPAAVVLGMTATGLSVARNLGRKGIKVFGLEQNRQQPGMFSRYVAPKVIPDVIEKENEFIDYLINFGKKLTQQAVLFCASDEYLACVSRNREQLYQYFKFNIPSKETVEDFLDKRRSFAVASKYGLPCPATYFAKDIEELKEISSQIKFPCALKPAVSHLWRVKFGGKKLIPVGSCKELVDTFAKIKIIYPQIMIQELIPGKDDQIYALCAYFNSKSQPLAFFIKRKLRQHPIHFGIGSFNISEMDKAVKEISLEFLTKIKYAGMGALELKRDSRDGKLKLTELNMRFLMTGELAVASGVDFPYIMYRDLIGEKVDKVFSFKEGVKLVNLELDLGSFWQYRKVKEITFWQYLKSFKTKKLVHTYFAWDDLMPFLFVCARFSRAVLKKILSSLKKGRQIEHMHKNLISSIREVAKWGYSFIPLRIRNGRQFFKQLEFLKESQWWSRQELENYQNEKLRKLIRHAYENAPYYHNLFKENRLVPDDIKTVKDLPKIPILTKDTIRENLQELIAKNYKPKDLKMLHTSGTTGKSLHFYAERKNEYLTGAPIQWRYFGWGGCRLQDIKARFGSYDLKPHLNGQRKLFYYNPVDKCLFLSINDLHRQNIRVYVAALKNYQPAFLQSYPSVLEVFIKLLKLENINLPIKLKAIFTNSEILYPRQCELFEDYFNCRVLDWYGLEERILVAADCGKHTGYHISSEYGIVEFINGKDHTNHSKYCDIVATGLTNFGMPLIRYKTEDLGYPIEARCGCGRGLPLMKPEGGRKNNFAVGKNGILIPTALLDIRKVSEHLIQFQFIQEQAGRLKLKILRDDNFTQKDLKILYQRLDERFGLAVDSEIEFTDNFERDKSGKFHNFVQLTRVNNESLL